MGGDHVVPPCVFDVAFEFYAKGTVIPKPVAAAINFAVLKHVAATFAKGNNLFHVPCRGRALVGGDIQTHEGARWECNGSETL